MSRRRARSRTAAIASPKSRRSSFATASRRGVRYAHQPRSPDPAGDHGGHEHHVGNGARTRRASPTCAINSSACSKDMCSSRTTPSSIGASSRRKSSARRADRSSGGRSARCGWRASSCRSLRRRNLDAVTAYLRHRELRSAPRGRRCRRDGSRFASPARRGARSRLHDARRCTADSLGRHALAANVASVGRRALPHSASDDTTA